MMLLTLARYNLLCVCVRACARACVRVCVCVWSLGTRELWSRSVDSGEATNFEAV